MAELTEEQKAEKALQEQEAAEKARLAATAKYTVVRPIEHDGKRYPEQALVTVTGKDAEPLLATGAIKPAVKEVPIK